MGCKASVTRSQNDGAAPSLEGPHGTGGSTPPASSSFRLHEKQTKNSSGTSTAGPTRDNDRADDEKPNSVVGSSHKPLKSSMPSTPRRSNADARMEDGGHLPQRREDMSYAQDDDPSAPPPPEIARHVDSSLTMHDSHSSSSSDNDADDDHDEYGHRENHFDPIPLPPALTAMEPAMSGVSSPPGRPVADAPTVRKDATGTFRTNINEHEKTDAWQAAKEYQQRVEEKRNAEEVHTKRRRLEEFDPVRPVDSFNVTHRSLLGRCWDRRAPELIPVSFVHAIAKVLGIEESHSVSTTAASAGEHLAEEDDFPADSPIQHASRLSRQSGHNGDVNVGDINVSGGGGVHGGVAGGGFTAGGLCSPNWTGVGGRRVPRRSHWFSVGGIGTEGLSAAGVSSPVSNAPFYLSSNTSSPVTPWPLSHKGFPLSASSTVLSSGGVGTSNAAGGGRAPDASPPQIVLKPSPSLVDTTRASTRSNPAPASIPASDSNPDKTRKTDVLDELINLNFTPEQLMQQPWETREKYYNLLISQNPRFMGIKDAFAFKLGSGVSADRSVKFLRKRNLDPAPGVTAMRWNRVEFFNPSFHTLVRAVAKTQGMSFSMREMEQVSNSRNGSVAGVDGGGGGNFSVLGLYANSLTPSRIPSGIPAGEVDGMNDEEERGGAGSPHNLHHSFSQHVMGHMENRSFARPGGYQAQSSNNSFLSRHTHVDTQNGSGEKCGGGTSAADNTLFSISNIGTTGSFLMGLHRHQPKGREGSAGECLKFPEDSVLTLALGIPCTRLAQLAGVPIAVQTNAVGSADRRSGNNGQNPPPFGLGSRKTSRDAMPLSSGPQPATSSSAAVSPMRSPPGTVIVALTISCFSVSINPFEWQERHYTRFPVDIDGSKKSSRSTYGEGIVTDIMYGGLMMVECSSAEAMKELHEMLSSMTWTEDRSLQGVIRDVRKHLKTLPGNLQKARQAAAAARKASEPASAAGGKSNACSGGGGKPGNEEGNGPTCWSEHQYRVLRRVGGRPMRDSVELEDISVFFNDDEIREEATLLHQPGLAKKTAGGLGGGAAGAHDRSSATASERSAEPRPHLYGLSGTTSGADPDATPSFSRVTSAWVSLPLITAVLRTWGLHLLACPEYAQPTAMFLQKHTGLAPVLQLTALGSFYHEGNTPSDEAAAGTAPDDFFFESDGVPYDAAPHADAASTHHPQPTPRIPKYNRFYASLPQSPSSQLDGMDHDDENRYEQDGRERAAKHRSSLSSQQGKLSTKSEHGTDDAAGGGSAHDHGHRSWHRCRTSTRQFEDDEDHEKLGPKSHSRETVEGEDHLHTAESDNITHNTIDGSVSQRSSFIDNARDATHSPTPTATPSSRVHGQDSATTTPNLSSHKRHHRDHRAQLQPLPRAVRDSEPPQSAGATRPGSRSGSPISPGRATVPSSSRNAENFTAAPSSRTSSPPSSTSSSFFETASAKTRHDTFVFGRNNSSTLLGGNEDCPARQSSSPLVKNHTASPLLKRTNHKCNPLGEAASSTNSVAGEAANVARVTVPASTAGILESFPSPASKTQSPGTDAKSGAGPCLFVPVAGMSRDNLYGGVGSYELVAMAATVGPGDSVAAQMARRAANTNPAATRDDTVKAAAPLPPTAPTTAAAATAVSEDKPKAKKEKKKRGGNASGKEEATAISSESTSLSSLSHSGTTKASRSSKRRRTKETVKVLVKRHTVTKGEQETVVVTTTPVDENAKDTPATVVVVSTNQDKDTDKKAPAPRLLPLEPAGKVNAKGKDSPTLQPYKALDTPTSAAGQQYALGTPSGFVGRRTAATLDTSKAPNAGVNVTVHRMTEEEAEGLWYMTMLEVKAQRQELEDLRHASREAEDERQRKQDELHALNRVLLPHTNPQDLDCVLLYLKTVLFEPEDIPHGRLFLQHEDWLPLVAAVWTSPANRIRSVEVATELSWVDIPRLGILAGLLFHQYATSALEELIIKSSKLLGRTKTSNTPSRTGSELGGPFAKRRRAKAKKNKSPDFMESSTNSLNFVTELDHEGSGFGPGCPPFFVAPEEARDTLWLLLCSIATNTMCANFRVVLRDLPNYETPTNGASPLAGGGGTGSFDYEPQRTPPNPFASLFTKSRREERGNEPLLLKPGSMLLDSFVVQPTSPLGGSGAASGGGATDTPPRGLSLPAVSVISGPCSAKTASHTHTHSNTAALDEAASLANTTGSLWMEYVGQQQASMSSPKPASPSGSRQLSSIVFVASSSQGTMLSAESPNEAANSFSGPQQQRTKSFGSPLRPVRSLGGMRHHRSSSAAGQVAKAAVNTHQHHVKRRPWVHDGAEVEERPFYEVLVHLCGPVEEARTVAFNASGQSSILSAEPYIGHYHNSYNDVHNDARFYMPMERQQQLQEAAREAVAVVNGEAPPREAAPAEAVYSSKPPLSAGKPQAPQPPATAIAGATASSSTSSPPPPPVVRQPPPLLFLPSNWVFGLQSAEEEMQVLQFEEAQLRSRAEDIWEALRKSVKHYNQAQLDARHKAVKSAGKSAPPPPPAHLITLEH